MVEELTALNASFFPFLEARSLFIELAYYGPDVLNYAHGFAGLIEGTVEGDKREALLNARRGEEPGFRKDYDASVDERLLGRLIETYLSWMPEGMAPAGLEGEVAKAGGGAAWAKRLFDKSAFDNPESMQKLLDSDNPKAWSKLSKDPAYVLIERLRAHYFEVVAPEYSRLRGDIERASGAYTKAFERPSPEGVLWMPTAPFD